MIYVKIRNQIIEVDEAITTSRLEGKRHLKIQKYLIEKQLKRYNLKIDVYINYILTGKNPLGRFNYFPKLSRYKQICKEKEITVKNYFKFSLKLGAKRIYKRKNFKPFITLFYFRIKKVCLLNKWTKRYKECLLHELIHYVEYLNGKLKKGKHHHNKTLPRFIEKNELKILRTHLDVITK